MAILLSALLLLARAGAAAGARPAFPSVPSQEDYTRYAHYPPYCSTPEEMAKRAVPPLQGDASDGSSQLIHVTALIRHGARTPYAAAPSYQCWDGFWDAEDTGVWNCDLKTYVSPPAATKEKGKQVVDNGGLLEEEPDFLFEKRYDALRVSPEVTGNLLNGTCQMGQLIMKGYNQELQNGLHLRQAYFYDGDKTQEEHAAADARMRLWDVTKPGEDGRRRAATPAIGDPTKPIYQEPNLRYRADDEQRTLMSGQVLLRGLFEQELLSVPDDETSVIRLHTADYETDVLGINHYTCPRTVDLRNEAYESDEYKRWIAESAEVKRVQSFMKDVMKMEEIPRSILDCLMTTICNDKTLPEALNDYDGSLGPTSWDDSLQSLVANGGDSGDFTDMFERTANFAVKNFTFAYNYNDAAYAKLGMGPLWKEMMANILPIVDSANHPSSGTPPPKLALFSGHDTTLMPILATLGSKVWDGTEWAPYASMIQIELHEMADGSAFPSGYAFRLIYNGKVLTSKMDGCADGSDLCDSQVLVKQVAPFAKFMERDCASTTEEVPPPEGLVNEMETASENLIAAPGGVFVVVLLVIFSMALGGALMFLFMRRRIRRTFDYRQRLSSTIGDLSMRVMDDDENPGIDSAVAANENGKYGATHEHTMI